MRKIPACTIFPPLNLYQASSLELMGCASHCWLRETYVITKPLTPRPRHIVIIGTVSQFQ